MGEVYKPENFVRKRRRDIPDIKPKPPVSPIPPSIETLAQEVERLKKELEKLKRALSAHGIKIN
jgi:hypothetical protein